MLDPRRDGWGDGGVKVGEQMDGGRCDGGEMGHRETSGGEWRPYLSAQTEGALPAVLGLHHLAG
jgi:hypothetical protein